MSLRPIDYRYRRRKSLESCDIHPRRFLAGVAPTDRIALYKPVLELIRPRSGNRRADRL